MRRLGCPFVVYMIYPLMTKLAFPSLSFGFDNWTPGVMFHLLVCFCFFCFLFLCVFFSMKFMKANRIAPNWTSRLAGSHLELFCLPMYDKKDTRLVWVKFLVKKNRYSNTSWNFTIIVNIPILIKQDYAELQPYTAFLNGSRRKSWRTTFCFSFCLFLSFHLLFSKSMHDIVSVKNTFQRDLKEQKRINKIEFLLKATETFTKKERGWAIPHRVGRLNLPYL